MSAVSVKVELPGHSHSFVLQTPVSSTVRDLKLEITNSCPGGPRVEGQRLIHGGRLLKDEEIVQSLSKGTDSITVHLAVHPSAWTTSPPNRFDTAPGPQAYNNSNPAPAPAPSTSQFNSYAYRPPLTPMPSHTSYTFNHIPHAAQPHSPLYFIEYKHQCAIIALTENAATSLPILSPDAMEASRRSAVHLLSQYGWSMPEVFDEPFPPVSPGPGVRYEQVIIDGQICLSLATPEGAPSRVQAHALKVLSYTYSILSMPPPSSQYPYYHSYPFGNTTVNQGEGVHDLNARLQELGFPPVRARNQNGAVAAQIRAIPLRPLLAPLIMLTIRILLLLYFFAPSKTPVFGAVIALWIAYEAYGAIRIVVQPVEEGRERANADAGAREPPAAANGPRPAPAAGTPPTRAGDARNLVLDTLANINLTRENNALSATDASNMPEPGFAHKVQTFVTLMFTTLHPALWNRRRAELVKREGRLRTEASAMQSEEANESEQRSQARVRMREQHARRPGWVRGYVGRVWNTEFADD